MFKLLVLIFVVGIIICACWLSPAEEEKIVAIAAEEVAINSKPDTQIPSTPKNTGNQYYQSNSKASK